MTAIRIQVTAEDVAVGPWPRVVDGPWPQGWNSPVELAIARAAGVDVDVDGDDDEWHATIGTRGPGSTLVLSLPAEVNDRLTAYFLGKPPLLEPFEFRLELDDWLVDFFRSAE